MLAFYLIIQYTYPKIIIIGPLFLPTTKFIHISPFLFINYLFVVLRSNLGSHIVFSCYVYQILGFPGDSVVKYLPLAPGTLRHFLNFLFCIRV